MTPLLDFEIAHTAYLSHSLFDVYLDNDEFNEFWEQVPETRAKLDKAAELLIDVYQELMALSIKEKQNDIETAVKQ